MNTAIRPQREVIRVMLADLKMPGSLEAIDGILAEIDGGNLAATEAINRLLSAQISLRNNRRLKAAMRSSRLPAVKTLESFNFSFQPSVKRQQIESLHDLGFIDRKENVVLLGPPGVGKSHLAISLAIASAQRGRRVYYGTLVDEIGYLPINHVGAVLFFQLMNRRYETASTVLTSNKGFEEWGEVLGDEIMAAALIDRVLHHCHLVNIRGNSYRMREHSELHRALRSDVENTAEAVRPSRKARTANSNRS